MSRADFFIADIFPCMDRSMAEEGGADAGGPERDWLRHGHGSRIVAGAEQNDVRSRRARHRHRARDGSFRGVALRSGGRILPSNTCEDRSAADEGGAVGVAFIGFAV